MDDTALDLEALRAEVQTARIGTPWFAGIRGLQLQIDVLERLGAYADFLDMWQYGRSLEASTATVHETRNHPSLQKHAAWAEREWTRLEQFGKIVFFPIDAPRPPRLNVNPCALLLEATAGCRRSSSRRGAFQGSAVVLEVALMLDPLNTNSIFNYG